MSPRDSVYVGHMLDMARKAVAKAAGVARDTYEADENLLLALTCPLIPSGHRDCGVLDRRRIRDSRWWRWGE